MAEELFRVENLSFGYEEKNPVLRNAFLSVHTGEVLGLLGRNGCGKSTLFNAITLNTEASASLFCRGRFIQPRERWKHIAYLPQTGLLMGSMRARWVINTFCSGVLPLLDSCGRTFVEQMDNIRVATLSGGERRYLEFLTILGMGRELAILDEPFAEMSPIMASHMIRLMHELKDRMSFVVSDHDYGTMKRACTRMCLLWGGEIRPVRNESMLKKFGYLA